MKNSASVKVVFYKHKTLKDGKHPILLQVIKDRKIKRISTGYSASKKEWDFKENKPSAKHPFQTELELVIAEKKKSLLKQVLNLDENNKQYSAATVVQKVKRKKAAYSVFIYFDEIIKQLKTANRIGNAEVYQTCKNVLSDFNQRNDLAFTQIDVAFLNKFETACKSKGLKESSISSYLRTLRAVFNRAINEDIITLDVYPFKQYKIGKLKLDTQKRAIRAEQIVLIEKFKAKENSRLLLAKNIFLFSYYTMGTNLVDIANLTWDQVKDGRLKYIRTKTHKPLNIILIEKAKQILQTYKKQKTDKYIFPIYSENVHITAQQKANRLHKILQQVNEDLKKIAHECGINEKLTTYVARHSVATILKRKGVSTTVISELLGHETEEITQTYLDSFDNPVLDKAVSML